MLGHKLTQVLPVDHQVWATTTDDGQDLLQVSDLSPANLLSHFNALSPKDLNAAFETVKPDVVVNAIGIVKQSELMSNAELTIAINASLPHRLQQLTQIHGGRLIHLSTDCVFSGTRGMYSEHELPDATDLYGRSKLVGETDLDESLTLRTSMIGKEIRHHLGLYEWLLAQPPGVVPGFTQAYFSGLPTCVLAKTISDLISQPRGLKGTWHVASDRISKFELLQLISQAMGNPWDIAENQSLVVDRSLDGSRFQQATGIVYPDWKALVDEMIQDSRGSQTQTRKS